MSKIKIKQVRSSIGRQAKQKRTLAALGLRRIGQEVTQERTATILGMVEKVKHLVSVIEI